MRTPYPYMGNKRAIAGEVWKRLGKVYRLLIPFFGSGSELLCRPSLPLPNEREIVNDLDCFLTMFWRAVQKDPREVARVAMSPVNEIELQAWNRVFIKRREEVKQRLLEDPQWCDIEYAGRWVWGQCLWIGGGSGWTTHDYASRPQLTSRQGLIRYRHDERAMMAYLFELQSRLQGVDVLCGDWTRCVGPGCLGYSKTAPVGIILDPPYSHAMRRVCYAEDHDIAADVRQWCMENGVDLLKRIALCGLDGEHNELEMHGWSRMEWKTVGGMSNQRRQDETLGSRNSDSEVVWFSPGCVDVSDGQMSLLDFEKSFVK